MNITDYFEATGSASSGKRGSVSIMRQAMRNLDAEDNAKRLAELDTYRVEPSPALVDFAVNQAQRVPFSRVYYHDGGLAALVMTPLGLTTEIVEDGFSFQLFTAQMGEWVELDTDTDGE
jgi:hypothetical protein